MSLETFTLTVLGAALILYAILGGADYGAGIVELIIPEQRRHEAEEVVGAAMGPVWEANHIWLILALVILFTGFPAAYAELCVVFHLPITVMLLGIVLRGSAFAFRHYDPFPDARSWYSRAFRLSSVIVPFTQGLIVAACVLGQIPSEGTFAQRYVVPWLSLFGGVTALFVCSLSALLAAVFLAGETRSEPLRLDFVTASRSLTFTSIIFGALAFVAAELDGRSLFDLYSSHPFSITLVALVTSALVSVQYLLRFRRDLLARFVIAGAVGAVVLGWLWEMFPFIIGGHQEAIRSLSLLEAAAPHATFQQLSIALVVGSAFILPALCYLLTVFKSDRGNQGGGHV